MGKYVECVSQATGTENSAGQCRVARFQDRQWRKGGPGQGSQRVDGPRPPPHCPVFSEPGVTLPVKQAWSPRGRWRRRTGGAGGPAAGCSDARLDRAGLEWQWSCHPPWPPQGQAVLPSDGSHAAPSSPQAARSSPRRGVGSWSLGEALPDRRPPCSALCSLSGWGAVKVQRALLQ